MSKLSSVRSRRSGTTLVEVLIASAILAGIMLLALMVMMNASSTANESTITGDLEYRGRQMLERCRAQFMTARFRSIDNLEDEMGQHVNNTMIWFQVPVNASNKGALRYGYSRAIGLNEEAGYGKSCILRFEAETVIRESSAAGTTAQAVGGPATALPALPTLSEDQIRDIDINKDGDLLDTFVRGKIMQYVMADDLSLESENVFADNVVLGVASSGVFNGDVDGKTSTTDLLFYWVDGTGAVQVGQSPIDTTGRSVAISIWLGGYTDDGKSFHLRRSSEVIRLKNPQF